MALTLAQIDAVFVNEGGLHLIGDLVVDESGVDPLGLRQLNLDLMDATVPGINNVTRHVRPYAFMAWAWWKAWQFTDADGTCDSSELGDRVTRYEAMYAWAHSLAGHPLIGATAIRKHLPREGDDRPFRFEGEDWHALKVDMTSIMAPTEYGPSIKSTRWLCQQPDGTFRPAQEALPAVEAIEEIVSSCLPPRLFAREAPAATGPDVLPFAHHLRFDNATPDERNAFRLLFRDGAFRPNAPRELKRRQATIDLVLAHMTEAQRPLTVDELRRILAKGALPPGYADDSAETPTSKALLCILQSRQLQRLATEAMLVWTEANLDRTRAKTSEALAKLADETTRQNETLGAECQTVGAYFDAVERLGQVVGWPDAAGAQATDVVDLMNSIKDAQSTNRSALPGLCLRSFAVVYAVGQALRQQGLPKAAGAPLDGRPDRLPFGILIKQVDELRDRPLPALWRRVIENWVIGQHVYWSAARGGDGKKRLRIALDDRGWIRVRSRPSSRFDPTGDRLLTMLSLGSECGLFQKTPGVPPRFSAAPDTHLSVA